MLTKDCFLPNLVELSKPASFLTSIGFYWDSKSSKFYPMSLNQERIHKVTTKVHLFVLLIILQTGLNKESNMSRKMISSFGLIVVIFCDITVQVYNKNLKRCVSLINELVKMSNDLEKEIKSGIFGDDKRIRLDTKEKLIKLLAPTLHWSAMAVPFAFVGGVVWSMPCMPSNLGYFLIEECSTSSSPATEEEALSTPIFLPKGLFLLVNLWIWSYGVQCAVFVVVVVMLGAMSLRSFLKFFQRSMLSIPSSIGPSPSPSHPFLRTNAVIYRRIQLLTNNFNTIHQLKILVPLIFTVTSHQVFSVFGAIKFSGQLNFVSYALFLILGSQGVLVIMGMFTGLADVYTMSVRVKGKLQKAQRYHRWLRRFHMSCQIIKIRFGALNFIDSFTPLAFENFAVVQTTNMLMVD